MPSSYLRDDMKILDIVKSVGAGIVREAVPGGGLILDVVNGFLPEDKKLPASATGDDMDKVISSLPPEQKMQLLSKEFDVDIAQIKESNETLRTMLEADFKTPHTTRPYIAKHSFHTIAFAIVVSVSIWGYGVFTGDSDMVNAVMNGWPFVLSVVAPFTVLLRAYFGVLKKEQENRLNAANKSPAASGLASIVSAISKRK